MYKYIVLIKDHNNKLIESVGTNNKFYANGCAILKQENRAINVRCMNMMSMCRMILYYKRLPIGSALMQPWQVTSPDKCRVGQLYQYT